MSGYAFHAEAFADLDEIWEYIAEDDIDAADRYSPTSTTPFALSLLSRTSDIDAPDLTTRSLRFHVVRRQYLIAYAPDESPLWIVAVIHGHRDPRVMAAVLRGRE